MSKITSLGLIISMSLSLAIGGCTQNPSITLHNLAEKEGLTRLTLKTNNHDIEAYTSGNTSNTEHLHIYLEGDGNPWFKGREPAINPTTRNPIALKLMLQDPQPSVYLNRPCYALLSKEGARKNRISKDDRCPSKFWTSGRYSQEVVKAMNEALDTIKERTGAKDFSLIGYSGGGALAVLIASSRSDVKNLLSIAANLDHAKWTQHFGYLPLDSSLNPIDYFPMGNNIERWHLIAKKDKTIPASILISAATSDVGSHIKEYENFDHRCCWGKYWPEILRLTLPP